MKEMKAVTTPLSICDSTSSISGFQNIDDLLKNLNDQSKIECDIHVPEESNTSYIKPITDL